MWCRRWCCRQECVDKPIGPHLHCNESIMGTKTCVDGSTWEPHFAQMSSIVGLHNITDIKRELMEHGPVTCAFKVYEDL